MSTNPFSRNRRATARPVFTFGQPQRPSPTQNFPVPHNYRPDAPWRPPPQTNTIPPAAGHPRNPFRIQGPVPAPAIHGVRPSAAPPGLPPLPTNPSWISPPRFRETYFRAPYEGDEAYAREQESAYACGCPGRLYANHAEVCPGPVSANPVPLGPLGNAGSAIASVPPLLKLVFSLLLVGRLCMTGLAEFAVCLISIATTVVEFTVFTAAPGVGSIVFVLAYWALVVFVVWWVLITAANMLAALTACKEPAAYYALKQGWLFLGNVSPLGSNAAPTALPARASPLVVKASAPVEQTVEAVRGIASHVTLAETAGVTDKVVDGLSRRTVNFGTCPSYSEMTCFPRYNIAATETDTGFSFLPRLPLAVS